MELKRNILTSLIMIGAIVICSQTSAQLRISDLGKDYSVDSSRLQLGMYNHLASDEVIGGNTSVRNESATSLKWKGKPNENGYGYFQRNRDLGQVFNVSEDATIDAIVLRSSRGNNAIMSGTPGASMYLQFFEVSELPGQQLRINDAGTRKGDRALHGFDHQFNRADDYLEGALYTPIARISGGIFPDIEPTTQYTYENKPNAEYGEQAGHLRFLRFDLLEESELKLKAGKRYAFILGFEAPGSQRGLALAISTDVHTKEDANFSVDANGLIHWGIRREGDGGIFPTIMGAPKPPEQNSTRQKLIDESMFPEHHWDSITPSTKGFPDVDTYRTLQFYIELKK